MNDRALHFSSIVIRRMRGLDRGFELEGLVPGINVVFGPNGAGKSTTACALRGVLWPEEVVGRRPAVSALADIEGERWGVELDVDRIIWQRDGIVADAPMLPSAETRDRYLLSLHELLSTGNRRFAALIAQEAQGGFDLMAARETLGARTEPRGRRLAQLGDFEEAIRARDNIRARQAETAERARELSELEEGLQRAVEARLRQELLVDAVDHARAVAGAREAEERLQRFPAGMDRIRVDDAARVRAAREQVDALAERRAALRDEVREAEARVEAAGLPSGSAFADTAEELLERAARARRDEEEELRLEQDVAAAEKARNEARRALGAAEVEGLPELDAASVDEATELARRGIRLEMERIELRHQIELLDDAVDEEAPSLDSSREGTILLRRWLAIGGAGARESWTLALGAAIGLMLGGLILSLVTLAALTLTVIGLAFLGLVVRSGRPAEGSRDDARAAFARLGLPGPKAWDESGVREALGDLEQALSRAMERDRRRERVDDLQRRLAHTDGQWREMEAARERLARVHGVVPGGDDYAALWSFVRAVADWRECQREHAARAGALDACRRQRRERLGDLASRLDELGEKGVTDAASAERAAHSVRRRRERAEQGRAAAERAREELRRAEADGERAAREIDAIFERLDIDPGRPDADTLVRELCDHHDAFRQAREAFREASVARTQLAARLEGRGPAGSALLEVDRIVLERELVEMRALADREVELRERCAQIREAVQSAKKELDLEEASARAERCADALVAAREEDVEAVVTDALVRFVREAAHERQLPAVFRRARSLFGEITRFRYELRLDPDTETFRAFDTRDRWTRELDELSSGTRVQLLLAVRVAFLDHEESGVRLPLVLDEVLANSDDERALALMRATVTLVRQGRQIFYFTAQMDEVEKWRRLLEIEADVEAGFFDLLAIRTAGEARTASQLEIDLPELHPVPAPAGRDHQQYGEMLGVPPLEPSRPAQAAHLWYLIDDPDLLHHLLERGIDRWGQLASLLAQEERQLLPTGTDPEEILARGTVLEAVIEAVRVGRGRRVDRAALLESGIISDTHIDPVTELCERVDGDARLLLEGIEAGEVKRFLARKREDLKEWLATEGYLDPRETLDGEDVLVRAMTAGTDRLDPHQIRAMVRRVLIA